jgi:hypothetical protein
VSIVSNRRAQTVYFATRLLFISLKLVPKVKIIARSIIDFSKIVRRPRYFDLFSFLTINYQTEVDSIGLYFKYVTCIFFLISSFLPFIITAHVLSDKIIYDE